MSCPQPLNTLVIKDTPKHGSSGTSFLNLLIWFLIIALIVYVILILLKPTFVLRSTPAGLVTTEVDQTKTILISVVVAVIIVVIIYILQSQGNKF